MDNSNTKLSHKETYLYLKDLYLNDNKIIEIENVKNKILLVKDKTHNTDTYYLKLPFAFPELNKEDTINNRYIDEIYEYPPPYIILLIRSGNASLGYFENGKNIRHKVIRKYMVRKKQGKSQLTYLKRKGKSKLGSRIRLAQTEHFFEEINEKLNEWNSIHNEHCKIFYSCPIRLWSYLLKGKTTPPFDKKSDRLIKIPIHIHTPNIKELKKINYFLNHGVIFHKL